MTKAGIRIFLVALAAFAFAASFWNSTSAQRGRDNFSHSSARHKKIACSSCHENPTGNWPRARGYPDVADYPGHKSCIGCHRREFFSGNKPAICAICHVVVSATGKARFEFPVKSRSQEFETIFPHDVHQDILASNEKKYDVAIAHFVKASFKFIDDDDKKPQINGCMICHQTETKLPKYTTLKPLRTEPLATPSPGNFTAKAELFKGMPDNHASCFNCHYQGLKPTRTDCAGCHRLTSPYFESNTVKRFSLKFPHLQEQHAVKDCTYCHVRITQVSDLRMLTNADVPLLTCGGSSCHTDHLKKEVFARQDSISKKETIFQCNYCHTAEIGSYKIPASHLEMVKSK